MTKLEMRDYLKTLGLSKDYRTVWDTDNDERGVIRFLVRGKFDIVDGILKGTEVILSKGKPTVWTSKMKRARKFCQAHGIRLRELSGECYFTAPGILLSEVLTIFGAKVRQFRPITDERREELRSCLKNAREARKNSQNEALQ